MVRIITSSRHDLERSAAQLGALNPLAILKRGYSITRSLSSLSLIKESRLVSKGERVTVKLFRGEITCVVEDKTDP
jgi:exodeoxyribonuclease VII large subunit